MKTLMPVLLGLLAVHAQSVDAASPYPNRPIRLVVPLAAGGSMDTIARGVSLKLTERLGQSVVVDNRGGGGSSIGAHIVAQSSPDGYTLVMLSSNSVIHPIMYKAPFDVSRNFAPVSQVTSQQYILVSHPAVPAQTVSELVTYAKANPGKLNYASSGSGSLVHLAGEIFKLMSGTDLVHIPYKGMGDAYADLFTGRTQLAFAGTISATPHIKAQRLRALGVSGPQRSKLLPALPTIAESGVPGFAATQWYGILGPAHMPSAVVSRLHREILTVLQQPDVLARMAGDGADPVGSTPNEFAAHLKAETEKWTRVIRQTGIRGD